MAKIVYFQFMALMGWLGNEAVVVAGSEGVDATVGGIYHGMAADGVDSAGKNKMISAGVCDKKKQNDLFNRICNQLKIFPSYGEQSFCGAFRTYAAVDAFVYGQSLYRIALCNEESDGNVVLAQHTCDVCQHSRIVGDN